MYTYFHILVRILIAVSILFACSNLAFARGQQQAPALEPGTPGQPPIPTLAAPEPIAFSDPATTAEYRRLEQEKEKVNNEYGILFYNKENMFLRYCLPYFGADEVRWLQGQFRVTEYIKWEALRRNAILSELRFVIDAVKQGKATPKTHAKDIIYYLKSELTMIDIRFNDEMDLIRRGLLKDRCLAAINGSPLLPDIKAKQ